MRFLTCLLLISASGAALSAADDAVYATRIAPMLKASCYQCHGPDKQKGGLRLDNPSMIRMGGKNGPVIDPGKPDDSPLLARTSLPADDPDIMPSKGDPLTKAQLELLRQWIADGAPFGDGTSAAAPGSAPAAPVAAPATPGTAPKPGDDMMAQAAANDNNPPLAHPVVAPGSRPGSGTAAGIMGNTVILPPFTAPPTTLDDVATGMSAADANLLKALDQAGGWSRFLTKNQALLDLDLSHLPKPTSLPAALQTVASLGDHVAWLDLAGTAVGDADLAAIAKLKNLRRLHLERTQVTDAGLATLAGATNLEWLNLYGTAITDDGLDHLSGLTHLARLYVWETKTTPAGVDALVKAIPGLKAERGEDALPIPPPPAPGTGTGKKNKP